jgi:peptide/nickel transport system permease protein
MRNILLRGDFGRSFEFQKPVVDVLGERVILSMIITLTTSLFVWGASLPIGIYAATHQYSFFDYFWTFLGFIGLAVPNFLLALLIAWIVYTQFGLNVVGLFSQQYQDAPWSVAKGIDLLRHLWAPVIVIGMAHTAGFIRIVRGTLLDELQKPYVVAARARGLSERRLLVKYPVRVVLNPMISTIGWTLPALVSGEVIVSLVLGIPTTGPILLQALMSKDMYLAGGIFLILSSLTIVGTLVSDILLTWLDPRIRYERLAR